MPDLKDLPPSQVEVMEVLWDKGKATIREVYTELSKRRKLAYKTVATLLMRLKDKGYVEAEERNFAYVFHPLIAKEQVIHRKLDDLVNKVLCGDLTELALYMAKHGEKLNNEQIDVLDDMVKKAKSRQKG